MERFVKFEATRNEADHVQTTIVVSPSNKAAHKDIATCYGRVISYVMMNRSVFWRRRAVFWFCPVCGAQAGLWASCCLFFVWHIGGRQRQGGRDHQRGQTTQHWTGEGGGNSQSWSSFATQVRGGVDRWFAEDARSTGSAARPV